MTKSEDDSLARYARQMSYGRFGRTGQEQLARSTALVVGLGALGSVIANTLARSGVGTLRIVDRDYIEWNNLQRQVIYTEEDVRQRLPKAIAAQNHLTSANSDIRIEAEICDVDHRNIERLCQGVDVIVDGTDNFEIRFLLNDASLKLGIPWVYGGCIGAEGQTMTILPHNGPCLRCIIPDSPPPGTTPTCDTAGILAPIIGVIASLQSMEAIKILSGHTEQVSRTLTVFDLWENRIRPVKLSGLDDRSGCVACGQRDLEWLAGKRGSQSAVLCGRNAIQLNFADSEPLDLNALAENLRQFGPVEANPYLLRATIGEHAFTLFGDGRCIVHGTVDPAEARSLYARYIGT
ncbi:thiazole biosynthesis adenylyltransferase ThiF [Bremerella cremea]|uniref:Thiazole biosynthesis adenylyltransferase ThiF n=1 Tax=Bremerella cremea TaxID=1031537 RepID=A0A368KS27_9BACT|nr:ThiF family adenylyltransferase [Bremerella cremea]RCS50562.1 thiazole biosynthesis adenylyltransferase ThiF [Bremerella cremea]